MESHLFLFHKKNLLLNMPINNNPIYTNDNYIQNNNKNENIVVSPYLIPGIFNKRRKYDEKYNLNNFISIFENEKPKIIGGGSFGQVFLVMNTINEKLYAIKHMSKKNLSSKLNSLEGIYKEIYIQSRIDHPNILPILNVKETSTDFHLVLEYASGGSLFQFIRKNKYLDEPLTFSLFIQVVNAVYFLHKNNLIHRDIKPENILLFENNTIKLCDFGWCVKLEEGQQRGTFCGTTEYMSPELVNHEEYSKEIDVWSLGILLYEMVHGYSPFRPDKPDFNAKDVIENIRLHKLQFHKSISEECKELIYHLLDEDPIKRYKVEDIFNSDFVKFYEKRKYAFPDSYLFEKYKFKLSKCHTSSYHNYKVYKNKTTIHSKSFTNNIICKDIDKIDDSFNFNNISTNENMIYTKKTKNIPTSLSDINLKCFKTYKKKLKKNNTSQYFHPLNIIENKINFSYLADSKSKNNSQRKMIQRNNDNEDKENINNNQEISKNETKIKTLIINNYFPNVLKNEINNNNNINTNPNNSSIIKAVDIPKNNKENIGQVLPYKRSFHIKPLKMSKIPINIKIGSFVHSPNNKLNTILDRNYLIVKKHLSPKVQINTENIKTSSFRISKNNDSKVIEVNKTNYCKSPKIVNDIPNPNMNKNNFNKKIYTRNNINNNNTHYENSKGNYNSEVNLTITNLESNNNHSYANYLITSNDDEYIKKKLLENKLYNNKSINQLKRNFSNENNNSMFKSHINNLNNNSIYYENECLSNKNTIHTRGNNSNINLNEISKINPIGPRTKQNSPLNTFNNNFIYTIFHNNNKKQESNNKTNIQLRNEISPNSSYNYSINIKSNKSTKLNILNKDNLNYLLFPKIKVHKTNVYTQSNNCEQNSKFKVKIDLDKILKDNDINSEIMKNNINDDKDYDKSSKLLNSFSQNSIFKQNKNNKVENRKKISINNNKTQTNRKIKNIPKIKSFKRNENLNINININNKHKNECFEKCRCNSNNNINNKKLLYLDFEKEKLKNKKNLNTNREIYNKIRNNSNKENNKNDLKYKISKKLEINEYINNININKENRNRNIITTSNNRSEISKITRINTSINSKNIYDILENNKRKCEDYLENRSFKNGKYINSKNYEKSERNNDIDLQNKENKSFNSNHKAKCINKKDSKRFINSKIPNNKNGANKDKYTISNLDNKHKKNLRYNQKDYKRINNGIILDKYPINKKENFGGYNDVNKQNN